MEQSVQELGYINLTGKVVISDPSYDRDVWCMKTDFPVKPGRFMTRAVYSDLEGWGHRVAALMAVHEDYLNEPLADWEAVDATIGVDTAKCGIFDDSAFPSIKQSSEQKDLYTECRDLVWEDNKRQAGIIRDEKGVVSASGVGDGRYTLYTISRGGENIALLLDYAIGNLSEYGLESDDEDEFEPGQD